MVNIKINGKYVPPAAVFGLTFRQHDNRKMQASRRGSHYSCFLYILTTHDRLPENPTDRNAVYEALAALETELDEEQIRDVKEYLENGGILAGRREHASARLEQDEPAYELGWLAPEEQMQDQALSDINSDQGRVMEAVHESTPANDLEIETLSTANWDVPSSIDELEARDESAMAFPAVPDELSDTLISLLHEEGPNILDLDFETLQAAWNDRRLLRSHDNVERRANDEAHLEPMDPDNMIEENDMDVEPDFDDWNGGNHGLGGFQPERGLRRHARPGDLLRNNAFHGQGRRLADGDEHMEDASNQQRHQNMINRRSKKDIDCNVCYETLSADRFPSAPITNSCEHEILACYDCIEKTIASVVEEGTLFRIRCPECPSMLSPEEIKRFASQEVFDRYKYLVYITTTPDLKMCLGRGCGQTQVHNPSDDGPIMTCNTCLFKTCTYHMLPWHEGRSCLEYDSEASQIQRLEDDVATAKLLASTSQTCSECQQVIMKIDGCDHMQCRCGKEWCYLCGVDWENIMRLGDSAHGRNCEYHPQFVRKSKSQVEAESAKMTERVHGGAISDELIELRTQRDHARTEALRPLAVAAAERRRQEEAQKVEASGVSKAQSRSNKRRTRLMPAWEEGGSSKKPFA